MYHTFINIKSHKINKSLWNPYGKDMKKHHSYNPIDKSYFKRIKREIVLNNLEDYIIFSKAVGNVKLRFLYQNTSLFIFSC